MVDKPPYVNVGGVMVERDALRIAEKINEYDPNLKVKFLQEQEELNDPPFAVVEVCRDGVERIVMYAWVLDDRLVDRVKESDTHKMDILTRLDAHNNKKRRYLKQEAHDILADANEKAFAALSSSKDTYVLTDDYTGKKIKIKSHGKHEVEES